MEWDFLNYCWLMLLLFGFLNVTEETTKEQRRELQNFSRDCHGDTCDYIVRVATKSTDGTVKVALPRDLVNEMMRLKVLLVDLSTAIQKDSASADNKIQNLATNMTSLEHQISILAAYITTTIVSNHTWELRQDIASLKEEVTRLSKSIKGRAPTGQPIIVRPAYPDEDLPAARGTDCAALYRAGVTTSGVYQLQPDPVNTSLTFNAYCDMQSQGGGWTVIQRREDGSDDFFRGWQSYKSGFGGLHHDFWLGLENIHILTKVGNNKMRIDLWDWEDRSRFSEFTYVRVADESDGYRILAGKYTGNAGDPFHTVNFNDRMQSMRFSTYDFDNDMDPTGNCARTFTSGWWFNSCFLGNLNGVWYVGGKNAGTVKNGIVWDLWKEHPAGYSMKKAEIKLRPDYF